MASDDVIKIWKELADEADVCKREPMPSCVIKDIPAGNGYRAQFCVRRVKVYHKAFEIKARAWIQNTTTGDVAYDSGVWMSESGANTRLGKALRELSELQTYRTAMAGKTKPLSQPDGII